MVKLLSAALCCAACSFSTIVLAETAVTTTTTATTTETVAEAVSKADQAAAQKKAMQAMLHANPVPNYMSILRQDPPTLALTDEQKAKLDGWFQENNAKSTAAVKQIIAAEQALAQASMDGVSKQDILQQADAVLAMRRAMIEQKTNCRDYVREVLSPEQWEQLVSLQKAALSAQ